MTVWEVGISDCESSSTTCICLTKEIAVRELFKERDRLVNEWKEYITTYKPIKCEVSAEEQLNIEKEMYEPMINNLSSNDFEKWNNYPHETPWIRKTEVIVL